MINPCPGRPGVLAHHCWHPTPTKEPNVYISDVLTCCWCAVHSVASLKEWPNGHGPFVGNDPKEPNYDR